MILLANDVAQHIYGVLPFVTVSRQTEKTMLLDVYLRLLIWMSFLMLGCPARAYRIDYTSSHAFAHRPVQPSAN